MEVLKQVEELLAIRGLVVSKTKTKFIDLWTFPKVNKGLDIYNSPPVKTNFVGHEFLIFQNYNVKRLKFPWILKATYRPSIKNFIGHKESINELLYDWNYNLPIFIAKANPIITGWCNYFRYANSSESFDLMSKWLYFRVNNWLIKKKQWTVTKIIEHKNKHLFHPNNPCRNAGGWYWYLRPARKGKTSIVVFLKHHRNDYKIIYLSGGKKHAPLPALSFFNLYDRDKIRKVSYSLSPGKRTDVLKRAQGLCKMCGRELDLVEDNWQIHHIHPIQFGGPDVPRNLAPLCQYPCHRSVTSAVKGLPQTSKLVVSLINSGILYIPNFS